MNKLIDYDYLIDDLVDKRRDLVKFAQSHCEPLNKDLTNIKKCYKIDVRSLYVSFVSLAADKELHNVRAILDYNKKKINLVKIDDESITLLASVFNEKIH